MILHVILIPTPRRQEYSFLYHFDTFFNLLSRLWVYKTCPLDAFRPLISYPVIYRTSYVVSSGFVPSPRKRRSLSLSLVSSYNLSPGFSDSIKLLCSPYVFFLSSYVFVLSVLLRFSTAFEFDETFPVLCHASLLFSFLSLLPPFSSDSSSSILSM